VLSRLVIALVLVLAASTAPAFGSAPELQCPHSCDYTIAGGSLDLRFGESEIKCLWTTGRGVFERRTTASTMLKFHQCREQMTVFKFGCTSSARSSRSIETNKLGSHLMVGAGGRPRIQLTGARLSFVCAGFVTFDVEGFFVARLEPSGCGVISTSHPLSIVLIAHGQQILEPLYDVYVDHRDDTYALATPWLMTFQQPVSFKC
jgi:hypothetical protein